VIVLAGRQRPPTLAERKATFWRRIFRVVDTIVPTLAVLGLVVAVVLVNRGHLSACIWVLCACTPLWVATFFRLTDVGPREEQR